MEYSVVVNNVEVVRVSGDEAAWNKFETACERVRRSPRNVRCDK